MKAISFGEVLWDIIEQCEYIGGAPFNLAAHLAQHGVQAALLTRVGADERGEKALREIERLEVHDEFVQIDEHHPTGWAKVQLDANGNATFEFPNDPAYNFITLDPLLLQRLSEWQWDVICFGTLVQRGEVARKSLHRLLDSVKSRHVFYDVNIRLDYYPQTVISDSLGRSTIVKLNADEAMLLCQRLYREKLAEQMFAQRLLADYSLELVCVTKGAEGCTVFTREEVVDSPAPRIEVVDTVGAGDAFSAEFLRAYCNGESLAAAARAANELGAYVASRPGAVPER